MSPIQLKLQRGDIISAQADVCVSSIHRSKDMTKGPLAKRILKCGGRGIQDELLTRDPGTELTLGQVEVVPPGKLQNFKELNFICLRTYQPGYEQILLQSILECLELAAVKKHKSVAFPALGVGHGFPAEKVVACLVEATTLHNYQFPKTSLDVVYVVLLDKDVDVIKTFLVMCARGTTDLEGDTTDQLPDGKVHDLDDSMNDDGIERTRNFDRRDQQAQSGAVYSGTTQKTSTHPPHLPNVMGQKKKAKQANQPARVNPVLSVFSFLTGIGHSVKLGPFNLNVKPKISNRAVGVQLNLNIDISFLDAFIPDSLLKFWRSITK